MTESAVSRYDKQETKMIACMEMVTPGTMRRLLCGAALLLAVLCSGVAMAAGTVTVGVVTDGPMEREPLPITLLLAEARNVLAGDPEVVMPENLRRSGDWTLAGINGALDALLADPSVDMIVTLGLISSSQAAQRATLSKPVIAPFVADAVLERFPLADGRSGRRNFSYVADFVGLKEQIRLFAQVVGFKHLAALVDDLQMAAIPDLAVIAEQLRTELGVRISIVPAGKSAQESLAALPVDADAVFVAQLSRLSSGQFGELAAGIAARHLPSLATSRAEVDAGMLLTSSGSAADLQRIARRIALDIQRIHGGENAADLEVALAVQQRLVLNMRTAAAIGFSPRWQYLSDAELLHANDDAGGQRYSLVGAMQRALDANPTLAASQLTADIARDDVRSARANLLPRLDASTSSTRIDAEHASPLTQAERSTTNQLSLQQLIYSDSAWAGYSISKHLAAAADAASRAALLDTLQSTAGAYLNLLRAKSVEAVRRANVENTRRNLETSRVREAVGLAERSDYLRWVAQLARDRASQLDAEATRKQAETELRRQLHLKPTDSINTADIGLEEPMAFVSDARTQSYIDTPAKWATFSGFSLNAARRQAPEIDQVNSQRAAQQRTLAAAGRSFFLPDLALVSRHSDVYWRDGTGSQSVPGAPGPQSWSVSLQASLPIFTGGERRAELARARHGLRQANAQHDAVLDGVDARVQAALQRISASHPSIELTQTAAVAAGENLAMVSDAYSRGIVSVTELIDAQEASLAADLAAAQAKYAFLVDFVDMLRATGSFATLLDPQSRARWYDDVDSWFKSHPGAT
jgi:outer membrane protein TolC